jgi:hypothetical protein
MFVYLINENTTNLYKIGVSNNPEKRLKSLQTSNGNKLLLVAQFQTSFNFKLEKFVHQQYHKNKQEGEWFLFETNEVNLFLQYCKKGEEIFKLLKHNTYLNDNL